MQDNFGTTAVVHSTTSTSIDINGWCVVITIDAIGIFNFVLYIAIGKAGDWKLTRALT